MPVPHSLYCINKREVWWNQVIATWHTNYVPVTRSPKVNGGKLVWPLFCVWGLFPCSLVVHVGWYRLLQVSTPAQSSQNNLSSLNEMWESGSTLLLLFLVITNTLFGVLMLVLTISSFWWWSNQSIKLPVKWSPLSSLFFLTNDLSRIASQLYGLTVL